MNTQTTVQTTFKTTPLTQSPEYCLKENTVGDNLLVSWQNRKALSSDSLTILIKSRKFLRRHKREFRMEIIYTEPLRRKLNRFAS